MTKRKQDDAAAIGMILGEEKRRILVKDPFDYKTRAERVMNRHPIWTATEISVARKVHENSRRVWAFRLSWFTI